MKLIINSKQMNYDTIQLKRDYLGGISFSMESSRKYKYTIIEAEDKGLIGKVFYYETNTPKNKDGFHGKGTAIYYENSKSKIYKSIKWLLKSMLNK